MGNTIDLCPQCRGKLVPIGERTGGFSAKKAVVGTVVAGGVVGLAAGATGKQLVTLKCVNCGYTIETDAKTRRRQLLSVKHMNTTASCKTCYESSDAN